MIGSRVIAIDGAAGSGKSTLARAIAERLGLPYVNTGEMYRAVAAAALASGVDTDDAPGLLDLARRSRFILADGAPRELEVEGWPRERLHTADVDATVSAVSRHPAVRAHLREAQRAFARAGAVMEGRDIASVVVPDARVKVYVTAHEDVRASRRAKQRGADLTGTDDALRRRDARDAVTTPHVPAAGADVVDTTHLDVDGAIEAIMAIVRRRAPELVP
ncbi:MAG TPA: (d)CMP kinase [Actinomycetota bacterium]|nr:(d)CMP kinase [Actinomycetota bacterium]